MIPSPSTHRRDHRWTARRIAAVLGALALLLACEAFADAPTTLALAARRAATTGARSGLGDATAWLGTVRRIVIDPGHGGCNEGAIGVGGIHEKHLTLPIAMHLADRLRALYPDVEIILTRQSDAELGLAERIELANRAKADLFISIHLNAAANPEAAGFETWWVEDESPVLPRDASAVAGALRLLPRLPELARDRQIAARRAAAFAQQVQNALAERVQAPNRGARRGNYTVLRRAEVPAVVVELGFLTHEGEGREVLSPAYQARLVDALVTAVGQYDTRLTAELQNAVAKAQ